MAIPPEVVQIPVKRYDVNLTMQDLMTPLTAFAQQSHVADAAASTPGLQQHARELADRAQQVLDAANRVIALAPHLLAPPPSDASKP